MTEPTSHDAADAGAGAGAHVGPGEGVVPGAVLMSSGVEPNPAGFTRPQRLAMRSIAWYQRTFSFRPSPCRFTPSCSVYSAEAIAVHGTRRGLWLTVKRLGRCRPLGPSGWDPVPAPHTTDTTDTITRDD